MQDQSVEKDNCPVPPKHIYYSKFPSLCHNASVVIVKSKNGEYVTQNCTKCGNADPLDISGVPTFYCPVCNKPVERVKRTKSLYDCRHCKIKWELATIVPDWKELFP